MKNKCALLWLVCVVTVICSPILQAQDEDLFPGGRYDPNIPTPFDILGHRMGEAHTFHWEMEKYIHAAAEKSDRVRLFSYGKTYEGRTLYYLLISSPENLANIDEIRAANLALTDPRKTSPGEARRTAGAIPAIVWLGYNIHGNETSGMEAAIRTVYQLAAGTDETTRMILENVVTIIDPDQNPDGHDRYVQHVRSIKTVKSHPQTDDYEHSSTWPGGRTNHYLFDLNRDFYLKTQIETQQKTKVFHRFRPHVVIDAHEMGSNSTFFMAPANDPYAEYMSPQLFKWWDIIAEGNARAFDRHGWGYYTKESFDSFYPGYGESYPAINGSIGILYEQASARGVSIERDDGYILTLHETTWHHFIASMATLESVAKRREECILDFYQFFADALESAKTEQIREIILLPGHDPHITAKLITNMLQENVEIYRATEPFTNNNATSYMDKANTRKTFPAGSYIIPMEQPQKVVIKTLLAPESPMEDSFLEDERVRKENREQSHIYDITGWSMPLTFGVEAFWTEKSSNAQTETVTESPAFRVSITGGRALQAYLVPFNTLAASKMLAKLLDEDFKVKIARKPFTIGGREWESGTLVVRVNRNRDSLHERIAELAEEFGIDAAAINTGLSDEGNDLGSNFVATLKKPKIAIVTGPPTASYSFGSMHYLFEREFGLSFTRITADKLTSLNEYNVVVLPSGDYSKNLDKEQLKTFQNWIKAGGTVVTVASSTEWLKKAEISKVKMLNDMPDPEDEDKKIKLDRTPGAIVKVNLDPLSFMSLGCPSSVAAIVNSDKIYLPFEDDKFSNAGLYETGENILLSGFIWPKTREYLQGKGFLFVEKSGRGKMIMFAGDPNFRAMYDGLNKLFLNALILSPGLN